MNNSDKVILDLCGGSASWSQEYRHNGYTVIVVDKQQGQDVRLLRFPDKPIYGILAAPLLRVIAANRCSQGVFNLGI